jgi:hypothetical protein
LTISSVICINKHVLDFANVALLCVAKSLATFGCMHILAYNIFVHQSGGWVARGGKSGLCIQKFTQDAVLKCISSEYFAKFYMNYSKYFRSFASRKSNILHIISS